MTLEELGKRVAHLEELLMDDVLTPLDYKNLHEMGLYGGRREADIGRLEDIQSLKHLTRCGYARRSRTLEGMGWWSLTDGGRVLYNISRR